MPTSSSGGTYSVNGCGTMVCNARGDIDWEGELEDCDAILAFCLVGIPLVPYRAVHTANWRYVSPPQGVGGWQYQCFPIRWSLGLLGAAYLRRLWVVGILLGAICGMIAYIGGEGIMSTLHMPQDQKPDLTWLDQPQARWLFGLASAALIVIPLAMCVALRIADVRHRNLRLVLGRHLLGSSDPAHWTKQNLQLVRSPQEAFGTPTYAEAAAESLRKGNYPQAMFAARLCAALEDRTTGEHATDDILRAPAVAAILPRLRRKPALHDELFASADWDPDSIFITEAIEESNDTGRQVSAANRGDREMLRWK